MADREKVIKALSELHGSKETMEIIEEAITLLKEQEPVEPIQPTDETDLWRCGNCNNQLFRCTHQRYCEMCGQAVKWMLDRRMEDMPIELPKTYIDGWHAGRKNEPYDNTKPITWQCGYNDGKYNLLSSLL